MGEDEGGLYPSQVRLRVLEDHAVLRGKMEAARALADAAKRDVDAFDRFAVAAGELLSYLSDHLDLEDRILLPTLDTIDAWGPVRAQRLVDEHAEQRRILRRAQEELGAANRSTTETVEHMEAFFHRLERDIELEESTTLSDELLAEFPIRTDFGGA